MLNDENILFSTCQPRLPKAGQALRLASLRHVAFHRELLRLLCRHIGRPWDSLTVAEKWCGKVSNSAVSLIPPKGMPTGEELSHRKCRSLPAVAFLF